MARPSAKARKPRQSRKSRQASRLHWVWGLLVLVAAGLILVLKYCSSQPLGLQVADEAAFVTSETVGPSQPIAGAQAEAKATSASDQATAAQTPDPFPKTPAEQIDWVMRHNRPSMILFHSTNCIPCKKMERLVAEVRGDYQPNLVFIDVITNDRANWPLIQQAGVRTIPTSYFVHASGAGKRLVGAMSEEALRVELSALLGGE